MGLDSIRVVPVALGARMFVYPHGGGLMVACGLAVAPLAASKFSTRPARSYRGELSGASRHQGSSQAPSPQPLRRLPAAARRVGGAVLAGAPVGWIIELYYP